MGRIIVTATNGQPMDGEMEQAVRAQLEIEIREFRVRERAHGTIPLRVTHWATRRGGWVITPGGSNPQLNGSRLIQLVSRVQVNGQRFRAIWNTDLPRQATLTAKFTGGGRAQELIEDEVLGLIATNEWPEELQGQVRFISVEPEEGSNARIIHFEATEEVVRLIQEEGGTISIGSDSATIRNNKKSVKRGANIIYRLQK